MAWEQILGVVLVASSREEGRRLLTPMVVRPVWFLWMLCRSFESRRRVSPQSMAAHQAGRLASRPAQAPMNFMEMCLITSGIQCWMRTTGFRIGPDCRGLRSARTILAVHSADHCLCRVLARVDRLSAVARTRPSFSFPTRL